MTEPEWNGTRDECERRGIPWMAGSTVKLCLLHFQRCPVAPESVRTRAATLIISLNKMEPWYRKGNTTCEYCRSKSTMAVVALDSQEYDDFL